MVVGKSGLVGQLMLLASLRATLCYGWSLSRRLLRVSPFSHLATRSTLDGSKERKKINARSPTFGSERSNFLSFSMCTLLWLDWRSISLIGLKRPRWNEHAHVANKRTSILNEFIGSFFPYFFRFFGYPQPSINIFLCESILASRVVASCLKDGCRIHVAPVRGQSVDLQ